MPKLAAGEEYAFGRDACGRIIAEKGFDGITRTYERDALGLVRHVTLPDGRNTDYIYDTAGRLCGVEYSDGAFEQYAYDDTEMLAGSEAYQAALVFYNYVKGAAANDVYGAKAVYEELRKRFPGKKKANDAGTANVDNG